METQCQCNFCRADFSIHPLRVESVAWATERRDLCLGIFFSGHHLLLLRANSSSHAQPRQMVAGSGARILCFLVLGKATAITLPAMLLILDIFPLRRLRGELRTGGRPLRAIFGGRNYSSFYPRFVFAVIALWGQQQAAALKPLRGYSMESRLAQGLFGASFYLGKTFLPVRLSPLYEIPPDFSLWQPAIFSGAALTVITTVILYLLRKRWPAGLACWAYSVVTLAPVLGIVSIGPQLVADRYSYLACLSWAVTNRRRIVVRSSICRPKPHRDRGIIGSLDHRDCACAIDMAPDRRMAGHRHTLEPCS